MDIDDPSADPFAGMNAQQRKRAQETIILEMAYDLSRFHSVTDRERPDFALRHSAGSRPFGIEVTQLFVDESQARLNLVSNYANQLWAGGPHMHKRDVKALQSEKVQITDKDGNIKHSALPVIIMETPSAAAFRAGLCRTIRTKAARSYQLEDLSHLNLVILDWYHGQFDASDYSTDRFFDEGVRAALTDCPFREVFLIVYNTVRAKDDDSDGPMRPDARIIPLQQLLALERFFVTGSVIDKEADGVVRDVAELNRLTIDHVSRVQHYGDPVNCEGRPFLRYRGTLIEVGERGVQLRDVRDFDFPNYETVTIPDRLDPDVEERVTAACNTNVFRCSLAESANEPNSC